ncbi:MAG: EamA family transporter [Clostridiales bacterium]|jgi:transporter family protein|nr:EamA family transporter [Clostridiales bacterium]
MYVVFALLSAAFSSLTAVLSKKGLKNIDSHSAVFLRTCVVLIFIWAIVLFTGAQEGITRLDGNNILFLALSGAATGGSWLCYYKALSIGDVNKVAAVDKSSVTLTVLIGFVFLRETVTAFKIAGLIAVTGGTYLMLGKKDAERKNIGRSWFLYAALSAVFAALTSVFAKIGLKDVNSDLGTALRTCVVLFFAGSIALYKSGAHKKNRAGANININKNANTNENINENADGNIKINEKDKNIRISENTDANTNADTDMNAGADNADANANYTENSENKKNGKTARTPFRAGKTAKKEILFLLSSGVATGLAWIAYFRALNLGEASVVAPIDKLSIVFTALISWFFLKEKITKKAVFGLVLLAAGGIFVIF